MSHIQSTPSSCAQESRPSAQWDTDVARLEEAISRQCGSPRPATSTPPETRSQRRGIANQLTDQQVRQVDIGKVNVGAAVVYRGRLANAEANVAEHDLVSELYHVIDGTATLKLGRDLIGKQRRPSTLTTVRLLNGPGNNAKEIRNGVSYDIKAGDVVSIPAGTGHQFTRIDDHVTYLMVRVDPTRRQASSNERARVRALASA